MTVTAFQQHLIDEAIAQMAADPIFANYRATSPNPGELQIEVINPQRPSFAWLKSLFFIKPRASALIADSPWVWDNFKIVSKSVRLFTFDPNNLPPEEDNYWLVYMVGIGIKPLGDPIVSQASFHVVKPKPKPPTVAPPKAPTIPPVVVTPPTTTTPTKPQVPPTHNPFPFVTMPAPPVPTSDRRLVIVETGPGANNGKMFALTPGAATGIPLPSARIAATLPATGTLVGEIIYTTNTNQAYVWDGTRWASVAPSPVLTYPTDALLKADTAATAGSYALATNSGNMYVRSATTWRRVGTIIVDSITDLPNDAGVGDMAVTRDTGIMYVRMAGTGGGAVFWRPSTLWEAPEATIRAATWALNGQEAIATDSGRNFVRANGVWMEEPIQHYPDEATLLAATPPDGTLAWSDASNKVFTRANGAWSELNGVNCTVSATAPTTPANSDLWHNGQDQLRIWSQGQNQWLATSSGGHYENVNATSPQDIEYDFGASGWNQAEFKGILKWEATASHVGIQLLAADNTVLTPRSRCQFVRGWISYPSGDYLKVSEFHTDGTHGHYANRLGDYWSNDVASLTWQAKADVLDDGLGMSGGGALGDYGGLSVTVTNVEQSQMVLKTEFMYYCYDGKNYYVRYETMFSRQANDAPRKLRFVPISVQGSGRTHLGISGSSIVS